MIRTPKYFISLDVGGTNCRIALIEKQGQQLGFIRVEKYEIDRDFLTGLEKLAKRISNLAASQKIQKIVASFPGDIDSHRRIIVSSANLPEWQQQPLGAKLEELTGIRTELFHDVTAAAAGEAVYGCAADVNQCVFLIWGTGFGGAKVEKLVSHLHLTTFEPGHYLSDSQGGTCVCGQRGCPELLIGGGSLKKRYGDLTKISDSHPMWQELAEIASRTVANVQIFHPTKLIVFSGGVIEKRPFLIKKIQENLQKQLLITAQPKLQLSQLKDRAALFGAVVLATEKTI